MRIWTNRAEICPVNNTLVAFLPISVIILIHQCNNDLRAKGVLNIELWRGSEGDASEPHPKKIAPPLALVGRVEQLREPACP
jgi:hypothetical protein